MIKVIGILYTGSRVLAQDLLGQLARKLKPYHRRQVIPAIKAPLAGDPCEDEAVLGPELLHLRAVLDAYPGRTPQPGREHPVRQAVVDDKGRSTWTDHPRQLGQTRRAVRCEEIGEAS